jgi:hypothetical protein
LFTLSPPRSAWAPAPYRRVSGVSLSRKSLEIVSYRAFTGQAGISASTAAEIPLDFPQLIWFDERASFVVPKWF